MKVRKGDTVKVLYGKDAGVQGKVIDVLPIEQKVVVEGANIYKRHVKGDGKTRQSEIVDIAKPMKASKVMLVCPACKKTTRIGINRNAKKKGRVCKKCSKSVDINFEEKEEKKEKQQSSKSTKNKTNKSKKKDK